MRIPRNCSARAPGKRGEVVSDEGTRAQVTRTLDALRAEGRRVTTARRLVVELLAHTADHLTADDLATQIHDAHPEIHLSTVYRTLDSLRDWELVEHVHQPNGPSFFHLAGAHRHLVCEQCGCIRDVPATEFDPLVARIRELYEFELHVGHAALLGRCRDHAENWKA
jgi:Fur family transcriptional regulator, ferric uptake regulator